MQASSIKLAKQQLRQRNITRRNYWAKIFDCFFDFFEKFDGRRWSVRTI